MHRRDILKSTAATIFTAALPATPASPIERVPSDRTSWLVQLNRVAHPVLTALSHRRLKATMPVEAAPGQLESRYKTTYLEAFARTLCGIAPWIELPAELGEEGNSRALYRMLAQDSLTAILDPKSSDFLDFGSDRQNIVDAAFLALAMLRAPQTLNAQLDPALRKQIATALRATRKFEPPQNNWLLFVACIEAALHALNEDWDRSRVDDALRKHMAWYAGDGLYGDGPHFHFDYYNSFVIHPFLIAILDRLGDEDPAWKAMVPAMAKRAGRYAHIQERLIAPDGSYPATGRSITYRCGAFHHLADTALRHDLPEGISPEQVRCALAAVIRRTLTPPDTFDSKGWLRIGLAGHQPALGEAYISTGSLYLCATAFLPLGLPPEDRFWAGADSPWSSQQLWSGVDLHADHAIDG